MDLAAVLLQRTKLLRQQFKGKCVAVYADTRELVPDIAPADSLAGIRVHSGDRLITIFDFTDPEEGKDRNW